MPNRLGLAFVARKLKIGTPQVIQAIQRKEAKVVLLASDASESTKKKITDKAKHYNIDVNMSFDTSTISKPIGRSNIKVIAIMDDGFANMYK